MTKNPSSPSQSRGRPVDTAVQEQQKKKLMAAVYQLLNHKSYKSITIREIAELAGTKSAMISYYFSNKSGLFVAMLQNEIEHMPQLLVEVKNADNPIKCFIKQFLLLANKNSAIIRFIHDEVLNQQSSLQDQFLNTMPKAISVFLPLLIEQEIQQGNFRHDLNAKYAAFTLMGMIMSPFVIEPIREQVWQISKQELAQPEWADHIYQLFITGCK